MFCIYIGIVIEVEANTGINTVVESALELLSSWRAVLKPSMVATLSSIWFH